MTFRRIASCAALIVGLVLGSGFGLAVAPAGTCEGNDCRTISKAKPPSKPLDLTRFMRHATAKSTASTTHLARSRNASRRWVARAQRHEHQPIAARPEPAAFRTRRRRPSRRKPDAQVQVVASDEFNEIDRGAAAAPVETTATATVAENAVQWVDAAEFNDIDRKADAVRPASLDAPAHGLDAQARSDHAGASWMQRLWTALQSALLTVVTALRQLIG